MIRAKYALVAAWQAAMALTLLIDPSQYSSPSYTVLFAIAPPWIHGVCWLAACLLTVWAIDGNWNTQRASMAVAFGMSASWALAFLGAWFLGDLAGWSGVATWSFVAASRFRDLLLVPREASRVEG